ncbi:hypothetical protein DB346_24635 [Verrucomicrobia bacterium LW23]|nr:hypothetical protein DB346_24635 [Verrucomicrobia bacterium LW23]
MASSPHSDSTTVPSLQWHNPQDYAWGIDGKGWTNTVRYYDRLPAAAEGRVTEKVWGHSRTPTGFHTYFETDSPAIHVRWEMREDVLQEWNMSRCTYSGLDLYAWDVATARWRWVAVADKFDSRVAQVQLTSDLAPVPAGGARRYLLYGPMRNPLVRLEIGVPAGAAFTPVPRAAKQIAFYGSSIVHGAFASRPGMNHASILGRMLGRSVINLGFSGAACMEPAMAELLAELDVDMVVVDALPNMHAEMVKSRAEVFLRMLCTARPELPIVVMEDFPVTNAWIRPTVMAHHEQKWAHLAHAFESVRQSVASPGKLHYVTGREQIGTDNEGTLDLIHPNDYGYMLMANHILPVARKALG